MAATSGVPAPPSHKLIPGCNFLVDGFRYAAHPSVKAFFLSHAHSDHYTGLRDDWSRGPIYCSAVTARLVAHMLGVSPCWLAALPLDQPTSIQGVEVTLVSANHCPGAVQFLFRLPDGRRYVHTGDMRFCPALLDSPHIQRFRGCHALFLDTTYCNPRYCFPPQEESIEYVAATIQRMLQEDEAAAKGDKGASQQQRGQAESDDEACGGTQSGAFRRLYLISTYGIGKERILTAVHDRCGLRLHVADRKHGVMQQLDLPGYDPSRLFTTDPAATPVRVVQWGFCGDTWPFFRPNFVNLEAARQEAGAQEVVGFVPTGWLYEMKRETFSVRRKGACSVHLVPYSEHSSYAELLDYVRFLRPHQVIPTVGVDGQDGEKERAKMQRHFRLLVDETASKARFLAGMRRSSDDSGGALDAAAAEATREEVGPDAAEGTGNGREAVQEGGTPETHGGMGDGEQVVDVIDLAAEEDEEEEGLGTDCTAAPAAGMADTPTRNTSVESGQQLLRGRGQGGPLNPQRPQQVAALGEEAAPHAGQQLEAAGGDRQAAAASIPGPAAATVSAANPMDAAAGDSSKAAAGGAGPRPSLSAEPSGGSSRARGTKRPLPAPPAKGKGKGGGGNKKQKGRAAAAASPGQKSITAFFGSKAAPGQQQQQQQQQAGAVEEEARGEDGSAQPPAAGGEMRAAEPAAEGDELALTLEVPLAADAPAAAADPSDPPGGRAGAGDKPRLVLPPPPSPGGALFMPRGGGGGGSAREASVARDALALPLGQYDPVAHACWEPGQPTPYLHLARAFDLMHGTKKRLRISDVLVNCFRSVLALSPDDLVPAAYLATGRVAPDYEGVELQVGGGIMSAAIVEATGVSRSRLHDMYRDLGDVGDVFQACKQNQRVLQRPATLTVPGVFAVLQQIAAEKGDGSTKRRQRAVLGLLRACRECEPRFLARTLVRNLRVGANWRSVVPALARAVVLHLEGPRVGKARLDMAAAAATAAFHVCPNLSLLADTMLAHPPQEWQQRCPLTPGMPIKPMLARISEGLGDALEQLKGEPFLAEYKYDGMRAQMHLLRGGGVRIFSRNCEDQTARWPDAAAQLQEAAQGGASSAIVDAELVAVDRSAGSRLRSFQELATRKKVDVGLDDVTVHVCIFAFDLLFRDGASLLHLPLEQRRRQLAAALPNMRPGRCALAHSLRFPGSGAVAPAAGPAAADDQEQAAGPGPSQQGALAVGGRGVSSEQAEGGGPEQQEAARAAEAEEQAASAGPAAEEEEGEATEERLQQALLEAFAAGTEGLMLKSLATAYEPSKRSDHWVKIKRDYCEGLHDTLDLAVIGAWYGNGRKAGWFSPYLLACYDPEAEELQSVCRVMSGFTDAFYRESKHRLSQHIIPGPKPYFNTGERPDLWFEPREVWEIRGADLSLSPVHKAAAGRVHAERGLGLRFPRFLGRVRDDKAPEDATTAAQIAEMYRSQTRKVEIAGHRLDSRRHQLIGRQPEPDGGSDGERDDDEGASSGHEGVGAGEQEMQN